MRFATRFGLFLTVLLALLSTSCTRQPTLKTGCFTTVDKDAGEPDPVKQDGVTWVPLWCFSGNSSFWLIIPAQVSDAIDAIGSRPAGTTWSVLVNGEPWTLSRRDDFCEITGPWPGATGVARSVSWINLGTIIWYVLFGGTVVIALFQWHALEATNKEMRYEHAEYVKMGNTVRGLERDLLVRNQALATAESQRNALELHHKNELSSAISAERLQAEAAEQRLRQLAQSMTRVETERSVDAAVRELIQSGAAFGRFVSVKFLASPTARVGFEWAILNCSAQDVRVTVRLGDKVLRSETGLQNSLGYQLKQFGRSYTFYFDVFVQGRLHREDLVVTVRIPTPEEWARTPELRGGLAGDLRNFSEQQEELRRLRQDAYERIDASTTMTNDDKEDWKADVDEFIRKQREKEGWRQT